MSSEKTRDQIQLEFSIKDRSKAEFWAWLTDGCAVSVDSDKGKAELKIVVLSKDTIKAAIREALSKNDSQRAQELLDAASKPAEEFNEAMVRKSIRVSPGEYVKLLYVKMLERTSFADVLMKVLINPCKKMVKELNAHSFGNQLSAANKFNHLLGAIELWEKEKPESRADVAEWGDWVKSDYRLHEKAQHKEPIPANEWDTSELTVPVENKSYTSITPFYSESLLDETYLEKVKAAFCRFALTDLIIKASGGDLSKPISGLFYEFKDEWTQKIEEEPFLKQISLNAFTDNANENQELFFGLYFQLTTSCGAKRELDLFSKYGEDEVKEFVGRVKFYPGGEFIVNGRYEGITKSEQYKNWVASTPFEDDRNFYIIIGTELDFTCCKITTSTPSHFEPDWPPNIPSFFENYRQQFELMLQRIAEKVGFENKRKEDPTYPNLAFTASQLIPKAIDKASTPEDYRVINNLLTLKNLYDDYRTITDFGEQVTTSTLKHHSVVSFYINSDLWRLVPLVLEGTNWIELVDDYLKERKRTSPAQTEGTQSNS
jgi:hypothetical protein